MIVSEFWNMRGVVGELETRVKNIERMQQRILLTLENRHSENRSFDEKYQSLKPYIKRSCMRKRPDFHESEEHSSKNPEISMECNESFK